MKFSKQSTRLPGLIAMALFTVAQGNLSAGLHAAEPKEAPPKPAAAQRLFASPDEASKALQAAVWANDRAALRELFGPEFDKITTGDKVQDANNTRRFAAALA